MSRGGEKTVNSDLEYWQTPVAGTSDHVESRVTGSVEGTKQVADGPPETVGDGEGTGPAVVEAVGVELGEGLALTLGAGVVGTDVDVGRGGFLASAVSFPNIMTTPIARTSAMSNARTTVVSDLVAMSSPLAGVARCPPVPSGVCACRGSVNQGWPPILERPQHARVATGSKGHRPRADPGSRDARPVRTIGDSACRSLRRSGSSQQQCRC